jgi:hypothetical protein
VTREARANLIFIVIFLLISAPGLVMLVKKKMETGRPPLWLPVPARQSLVYIDPIDAPPTMRRLTPALTAAWVADLVRNRFDTAAVPMTTNGDATEPVMSANRLAQLVADEPTPSGRRVALLVWNLPRDANNVKIQLRATTASADSIENLAISDMTAEPIDLPHAVKRDLQDSGIPAPPFRVWWVTAVIPLAGNALELTIDCTVDGKAISDTLTLVAR